MKEHMDFRHREEKMTLHYYALQRSNHDYYVILSYVPDAETCLDRGIRGDAGKVSRLLDLLEMWCCLMFQTLPEKYLREFLPDDMLIQPNKGLNLQLPLRNSDDFSSPWREIRCILAESPDLLHQEYYSWQSLRFHHDKNELREHHKRGLDICKKHDGISNRSPTPSRPNLLSPPSTTSKITPGRLESEASKQLCPSTPSMTKSTTISGGGSRYSTLADRVGSNMGSSGDRKRNRDDNSFTEDEDLRGPPVNRKLFQEHSRTNG